MARPRVSAIHSQLHRRYQKRVGGFVPMIKGYSRIMGTAALTEKRRQAKKTSGLHYQDR